MSESHSPLWPNPAPRGPFTLTNRIPGEGGGRRGSSVFRLDDTDITITIIDGESLTDILNRVYALGKIELAVELASSALHELAETTRFKMP